MAKMISPTPILAGWSETGGHGDFTRPIGKKGKFTISVLKSSRAQIDKAAKHLMALKKKGGVAAA